MLFVLAIAVLIAIPQYYKYSARESQKTIYHTLRGIAATEISYFADKQKYAGTFEEMGWALSDNAKNERKYAYFLTPSEFDGADPSSLGISVPFRLEGYNGPAPGVSATGFTVVAVGNIDRDEKLDIWYITDNYAPVNVADDLKLR